MKRVFTAALAATLLLGTTAGCTGQGPGVGEVVAAGVPTAGDPQTIADVRLGDAIEAFGFRLLEVSSEEGGGNVVVSPLSAHAALSMTYAGATGDTANEMADVLEYDVLQRDEVYLGYANLLAGLAALPSDAGTTLDIENSLWADEGFELHEEFAATDRSYFGAQLETLDLQGDGTRERINGWVAERTNDKITELIDQIPDEAVIYLINAVYLKGGWSDPFDAALTAEEPFSIAANETVDVPMMRRSGAFVYAEIDGTQAVRLPYRDGRLAMWVVLPPAAAVDPRETAHSEIAWLADGGWREILESASNREGFVVMPTFTSRTKTDLAEALKAMGMPLAFDPAGADFSDMSPQGAELFISRVLHETYIAVDETGTEAAAATAVEGQLAAVLEPPPAGQRFNMTVDRPFLFVIEDSFSGAPLFLGAIEDPR